jgi:hypothetical protein
MSQLTKFFILFLRRTQINNNIYRNRPFLPDGLDFRHVNHRVFFFHPFLFAMSLCVPYRRKYPSVPYQIDSTGGSLDTVVVHNPFYP